MSTITKVLNVARSQLGYHQAAGERTKYGRWYGMDGVPWCFAAGTLIDTPRGLIPIEEIDVGQLVLSATGRARRVEAKSSHSAESTILLKAQGLDRTVTTPEHPYWARRRLNGARAQPREVSSPEWIPAGQLRRGDYVAYPVPEEIGVVDVDPALAYVVGRWIGDGWKVQRKSGMDLFLCCARAEEEEVEKALSLAQLEWNREQRSTATQYRIGHDSELKRIIEQCGARATGKRLSGEVFYWPREAQEQLLAGYVAADGWSTETAVATNTASRTLALGVAKLVRALGYSASVQRVHRERVAVIQGRTVHQRDCWSVGWSLSSANRRWWIEDGYLWSPVTEVSCAGAQEVFNLSVAVEKTFVADGLAVHNCDMFVSWVGVQAGAGDVIGRAAYTPTHAAWFQAQGLWGHTPRRGAIVFYNFGNSQQGIQHVGIVESVRDDGRIVTIEGNTRSGTGYGQAFGGGVYRRVRSVSLVAGYGYPRYNTEHTVTPMPLANQPRGSRPPLIVDGQWGRNTTRALQRWLGVLDDGQIGPDTRKALQRMLRETQDGSWGRVLRRELQRVLRVTPDGDWGPQTIRALQRKLNSDWRK